MNPKLCPMVAVAVLCSGPSLICPAHFNLRALISVFIILTFSPTICHLAMRTHLPPSFSTLGAPCTAP